MSCDPTSSACCASVCCVCGLCCCFAVPWPKTCHVRRASSHCLSQPRSPSPPSRRPSRSRVARRCPTRTRTRRARTGRTAAPSASRRTRCSRCRCRAPRPRSSSRFACSAPLPRRCVGDGGDGKYHDLLTPRRHHPSKILFRSSGARSCLA